MSIIEDDETMLLLTGFQGSVKSGEAETGAFLIELMMTKITKNL
jgi:hypothetical protein